MIARAKSIADYVDVDPNRLGGEPVFKNTRVPIHSLFTYLRKGISLDQFLDDFEGVGREQADSVIELAELNLVERSRRA